MAHAGPDGHLMVAAPPIRRRPGGVERTIDDAQVRDRVELIPRFISDEELLSLMSRCTATIYLPVDEDSTATSATRPR